MTAFKQQGNPGKSLAELVSFAAARRKRLNEFHISEFGKEITAVRPKVHPASIAAAVRMCTNASPESSKRKAIDRQKHPFPDPIYDCLEEARGPKEGWYRTAAHVVEVSDDTLEVEDHSDRINDTGEPVADSATAVSSSLPPLVGVTELCTVCLKQDVCTLRRTQPHSQTKVLSACEIPFDGELPVVLLSPRVVIECTAFKGSTC